MAVSVSFGNNEKREQNHDESEQFSLEHLNSPLPNEFYYGDCTQKSKELLGKILIHRTKEGTTAGIIVETEAYLGEKDPACHASAGLTSRTWPFYGGPGVSYVFTIYGIHYCFNVITNNGSQGECVLIRALEPIYGIELMNSRRKAKNIIELTNGPAKLSKSMGFDKTHTGFDLTDGKIAVLNNPVEDFDIVTTTRIGIKKAADWPLRFYIEDNPFVSKKINI